MWWYTVAHLEVEDDGPEESQGLLTVAVHHSLSHPLWGEHVSGQAGQGHLHIVEPLLVNMDVWFVIKCTLFKLCTTAYTTMYM